MSLINDALKKARQTQQQRPPAASPLEFRAGPAPSTARRTSPLLLVVLFAGLAMAGGLIWLASQVRSDEQKVAAAPAPTLAELRETATVEPSPTTAQPPAEPASSVATNAVPPPPPLPKLQGIFFNPTRPSAVVDNKTVFRGSRVGEFRVVDISRDSVTLGNTSQTNVLSLSE